MKISIKDQKQLKKLEESLWKAETRFDKKYMDKVLAPDFFEFGRSGSLYSRKQIIDIQTLKFTAKILKFKTHVVAPNVVLVSYVSYFKSGKEQEISNRSSLWVKTQKGWQIKFHQGTPKT